MSRDQITIRDANITKTNFAGRADDRGFDQEGKRYILVRLDPDDADRLRADGWPVKRTKERPERPDYEPYDFLKIKINFNGFYYQGLRKSSRVYMVTKNNNTLLEADDAYKLDENYIEKADIKVDLVYYKTYDQWSVVLESGFFTIEPDDLYEEYFGSSRPVIEDDDDEAFV